MIVDVHTHAFPEEIRRDRERFFPGEPAFQLLYDNPKSRLVGASETVAMMDEAGVDVSVVFGFPWRNEAWFRLNNDYILEAVSRYPKRLVGFCCLDPAHDGAAAEVERCLDAGMGGVGELAFYVSGIDRVALDRLSPLMALCRERNRPVMIHTNEPVGHAYPGKTPNTLKQIYDLVVQFPDNRIILAHWGGGLFFYSLLKKQVREALANVWMDTAASPFLYHPAIYRTAVELIGSGKVLLGTDFPLLKPSRYFEELAESGISDADREAICGASAAALLGLSPST
ncbi:MAG: amidohydrolase family protein [Desulfobacteraceae bacterium]|nr:amidohydrolase family protein [Desulfobacteraceae bacterium]